MRAGVFVLFDDGRLGQVSSRVNLGVDRLVEPILLVGLRWVSVVSLLESSFLFHPLSCVWIYVSRELT